MPSYHALYALGQTVYLRTDTEQRERLVTGVEFQGSGGVLYNLSCCMDCSRHYEMEISDKQNQALKLGYEEMRN